MQQTKTIITKAYQKNQSMAAEFREFIARGNMIDLAVGLTVGTAFTQLVNSMVNDMIMPPIGYVLNNVNFSELYINLSATSYENLADAEKAGAPVIKYGSFITVAINFLVIAIVIFLIVKVINRLRRMQEVEDIKNEKEIKKTIAKKS